MTHAELKYKLEKYFSDSLPENEVAELWNSLQDPEFSEHWENAIQEVLDDPAIHGLSDEESKILALQNLRQMIHEGDKIEPVPRVHAFRKWWWAAASVILLLGAGAYFWINQVNKDRQVAIKPVQHDAMPGKNGAILTLADGKKVVLDSLGNGTIATQHGSRVNLQNGQVIYNLTGEATETVVYNTMNTPNGRQFQLKLPDGTMVWLNAASSITYPTIFTNKERHVKVTGEVYFEVAKDAQKPFTVDVNNAATVQVLGTHFNVNAYVDEAAIRTTLLEGKVNVIKGTAIETLQPGQQAAISDQIRVIKQVNTDLVMAWKNGVFNFNQLSLAELMRQLSRWYDVEVVYTSSVPDVELYGEMGRDLNLSQVLQSLKEMDVKCRLEGKRLIVD